MPLLLKADLEAMHTKQLMKLQDQIRQKRGRLNREDENNPVVLKTMAEEHANQLLVKEVLSTREHVPNKREAKLLRQMKANAKKNR